MALKPWYKVVTPREDLREGEPLDASEFAVHLDHVREGRAPADYQEPDRFFERTFLTKSLKELATGVLRRLSGSKVETSPIYNLTTQFGGGKTHALTLLYHLASNGQKAKQWKGVPSLLDGAGAKSVPSGSVAVFVGTEFDSLTGRGGKDGTPLRKTPWGEIAFQFGDKKGFSVVAKHDEEKTAPSTEVIRQFLPSDKPVLILLDELLNYMGRNRKSGLTGQLYSFIQNLSEEVRAQENVVLVVSLPSLLDEMTPEDEADFDRFQKMLDRLGRAMMMSAEAETSEIIRRRLFEWGGLPDDGKKTATEYAQWILEHRALVPTWFPVDNAREAIAATYPFHPALLSVFERKWQQLPRFQQTRGILRLLALWVSNAYQAGFKGAHKDPLICMGTAPIDDPLFRSALFDQLGTSKLEGAMTTDISGKKDSHALRLDKEAIDAIKKARLHQKIATTIFFESNGGQAKAEATLPEIRLAAAEPVLDVGNIETALEELTNTCYYLSADKNRYRFSLSPNLNKLLADRRASVPPKKVDERVRAEVHKVFAAGSGVERCYFPEKSGQITNAASLTFIVLSPDQAVTEKSTKDFVDSATKEHGTSARTFKSALIWIAPDGPDTLRDEARKVLAWEDIDDEKVELRLDDTQKRRLSENIKKAQRDLKEAVWRTYKNVLLLGKDGGWKNVDLGLVHSSNEENLVKLILKRLCGEGDVEEKSVSPSFLARNWAAAFNEWSTRAVRDAFFASPQFPRLLNPDSIKDTISKGVENGMLGYVGKKADGTYEPFLWKTSLDPSDVEISDDTFLILKETAEAYNKGEPATTPGPILPPGLGLGPGPGPKPPPPGSGEEESKNVAHLTWKGEIPHQKWMNFYSKVLARFVSGGGMKLTLHVEIAPEGGVSMQKTEETQVALKELGVDDNVEVG
ncbi:ATP-binding protein [Myxococcota bacterium]